MKRKRKAAVIHAAVAGILCLYSVSVASCDMLGPGGETGKGEGQLRIAFASSPYEMTKVSGDVPDTSDFILTVSNSAGSVIYQGPYGDSPESIMVKAGSYMVSVVSENFTKPAFSKPQYGDDQCVVVPSGGVANVKLTCRQVNSGVRLDIDPGFLASCPDGVLFLASDEGKLMYGYSEKRIAYFLPGNVSLLLSRSGKDDVLVTRKLEAQQVLVLGVSVSPSYDDGGSDSSQTENITVDVDTSRVWISDDFVIGGDDGKGSGSSDAMTVTQAMSSVGEEDVWVNGYIVGGNLTSSSALFEPPFSSRTCLLLGPRSSTAERSSCISVQLPSGDVRDALNLVDNPELFGRKVSIKGDIVPSYYGLVGLKNCSDYKL